MKKSIIIFSILSLFLASCEKFLEENPKSVATTDQFKTAQGQEQLVNACYVSSKIWYAKEEGYDMSDVGTDIYTYAEQSPAPGFFTFDPTIRNSRYGRLAVLWVEFYQGVNACNNAIQVLENNSALDEATTKRFLAEVHFLRALYFYHLTEMWGRIAMPLEPTVGVKNTIELVDVNDVYDQILKDINYAADNLSATDNMDDSQFGRVTRDAAIAFRARAELTIASYIQYAKNTPPYNFPGKDARTYFDKAYDDATAVINTGNYSFYNDYADLWSLANNSSSRNQEGIWAINYSRDQYAQMNVDPNVYVSFTQGVKAWDEREGGNHGHLMWGMEYRLIPGMSRVLQYGRTFRRYMPTSYLIDLFKDRANYDARFHGQFRTVWLGCSDDSTTYPVWGPYKLPDGTRYVPPGMKFNQEIYHFGDTSCVISMTEKYPADSIAQNTEGNLNLYVNGPYFILTPKIMYNSNGTINSDGTHGRQLFLQPDKFDDPERTAADGTGSERGIRDAYVFRLAEMYLIAAEAAVNGSHGDAEARSLLKTYRDSRALPGYKSVMENEIDNATLDKDFFLAERAREFIGEQLRWFDLKRTHTPADFVSWIKEKNPDTRADMQTYNYLYPYPSAEMDAVVNKDVFGDNNGYGR